MDILLIGGNGTSYSIADGTRAITLVGVPPITTENLLYVYNKTQDLLYYSPTETLALATVTGGNVINIDASFAVLADTDVLHIQLSPGELAYDITLDANKDITQNPEWSHYTSPEHVVDETNLAVNNYFIALYPEGYRNLAIQLSATDATGASFVLYATLDDAATVPATGGTAGATWIDITTLVYGGTVSGTSISSLGYIDTNQMPERYLLEYTVQNATNTVDVWTRKY